jgi:hypothetical protein
MGEVVRLPAAAPVAAPQQGDVFADARGGDRAMRVTWHSQEGVVVLSLWREAVCTGTFRIPAADLPALLRALTDGPLGRA